MQSRMAVTVHTAGRNEEHADEDKLKITVFNKSKQGKTRQGWHTETPGVTSRPDGKELNRQELNTQGN